MTLNKASVTNIIGDFGDSPIVMVYGLKSCKWGEVCKGLVEFGYIVLCWDINARALPWFKQVDYDLPKIPDVRTISICCKATITSLIAENYRRTIEGLPIIPLIFCVALEHGQKQDKKLNITKVAHSHTTGGSSTISDTELRRCYKIYAEMDPVIKQIAEATFKFVKVKQKRHHFHVYEYELEQIPPFWQDPNWNTLWQARKHAQNKIDKPHPWRQELSSAINKLAATSRFFQLGNASVPHLVKDSSLHMTFPRKKL